MLVGYRRSCVRSMHTPGLLWPAHASPVLSNVGNVTGSVFFFFCRPFCRPFCVNVSPFCHFLVCAGSRLLVPPSKIDCFAFFCLFSFGEFVNLTYSQVSFVQLAIAYYTHAVPFGTPYFFCLLRMLDLHHPRQVADDDRTLLPALECLASIVIAVGGALDVREGQG